MAVQVWSQVVDRMVAVWTAVKGQGDAVFEGPPVSVDLVDRWVTVGYQEDPQQQLGELPEGPGGQTDLVEDFDGLMWRENGHVLFEITVVSGDPDLSAVRARAFEWLNVLSNAVRADKLAAAGLGPGATVTVSAEPVPLRAAPGAEYRIRGTLTYSVDLSTT